MSDGKVHNLQATYTDFGHKPKEGYKFCLKCKSTLPLTGFL